MTDKSFAHLLVQDLLRVQAELGCFPSRDQYIKIGKYPKSVIVETFGSWTAFIQASGLARSIKGRRDKQEIRKEAFERLKQEVEARKRIATPSKLVRNLILLPDLHAPAMHPQAVDFIKAVVAKYGFDHAACTGDEIDGHSWSFHDHDPDTLSPGHELEAAIKQLKPLYELFPEMDICSSNHGDLFYRKAKHHGIPARVLKSYREVIDAPMGWNWHFEIKLALSNGKRLIIHHSYSANALQASQSRGVNYAAGHHHSSFSIQYWRSYDDLFFACFAGCLVDETTLAMEYGKNIMRRPVLGLLRIEDGIPHLVPMITDRGGVWTGRI